MRKAMYGSGTTFGGVTRTYIHGVEKTNGNGEHRMAYFQCQIYHIVHKSKILTDMVFRCWAVHAIRHKFKKTQQLLECEESTFFCDCTQ